MDFLKGWKVWLLWGIIAALIPAILVPTMGELRCDAVSRTFYSYQQHPQQGDFWTDYVVAKVLKNQVGELMMLFIGGFVSKILLDLRKIQSNKKSIKLIKILSLLPLTIFSIFYLMILFISFHAWCMF